MTDEDFDRVDVSPKDIEEALQRPSDFGMASSTLHYDDFFETWSLGPVVLTRASTLLEESNHKALISYLDDLNLPTEWLIVHCNHWGCGWVDHLAFHAVNSDRTPTKIFKAIKSWFNALSDYPVADESDYSQMEYDATLENIETVGGRFVDLGKDLPEGEDSWMSAVFGWLWENDQEQVQSQDDRGGCPSKEAVIDALIDLGLLTRDEDITLEIMQRLIQKRKTAVNEALTLARTTIRGRKEAVNQALEEVALKIEALKDDPGYQGTGDPITSMVPALTWIATLVRKEKYSL